MLCFETIAPETRDLLVAIQSLPELSETRLVGGTALALQFGHRISVDLDIFGKWDYSINLFDLFSKIGTVEKVNATPNGRMAFFYINGIKVDCVSYDQYPWISPPIEENGIRLANVKDIGAMKINAIVNRGTRKDFIDLDCLLETYSLNEIFAWYHAKYPEANSALAVRSLSYFEDAESMPLPRMLIPFEWELAKKRIAIAVRQFIISKPN